MTPSTKTVASLWNALMGVVSALMRFGGLNFISEEWMANPLSELAALAAYVLLICYFIKATSPAKTK